MKEELGKEKEEMAKDQVVSVAPAEGQIPIPLFMDADAEYLTFPKLFPTGQNGMNAERRIKLAFKQYVKN